MNMYKSKGKEFDAVIIVEGRHHARFLDPDWDAARITQRRRVLRVAITRARDMVVFMRPWDAAPLTPCLESVPGMSGRAPHAAPRGHSDELSRALGTRSVLPPGEVRAVGW
jgi:transposase